MAAILGFILALMLYKHFNRRVRYYRRRYDIDESGETMCAPGPVSWHKEWERHWAEKFRRQEERRERYLARHEARHERRRKRKEKRVEPAAEAPESPGTNDRASESRVSAPPNSEQAILARARKRASAELAFYNHVMSYLGVMAMLALINVFTTRYPWFLWPAMGWGIGIFSHYMAVFGSRKIKDRYFYPAVEREVRRETMNVRTEKQASIDELSASIAHEIRNPIAAAKSLVQQMGEDPRSIENVEYAHVALDELDRVERSISHLLKYAKEEDLQFAQVSLAGVIDSSLIEMRGKLDAANVAVARNYIGGPTLVADGEKLRQVFTNILENAIDAFPAEAPDRRIDLYIENGVPKRVRVRLRDNGNGIPPEKIDRIFNPFFTTKEKGTGLGMAISKKIVEAHEGTIDVVSEEGRGTEFVVTLPLPQ
ncbi:MAG: GHKL domain-containing protein [Deltaproteobacteria bacterium]|nr:GHKL domain-containing protein [Deltaproteobacteria bacterium]